MALQTSGQISLEDIRAEFEGPTSNVNLLDYYRGGSYVPDSGANAGIPSSGQIGLTDFYGGVNQQTQVFTVTEGYYDLGKAGGEYYGYIDIFSTGSINPDNLEGNDILHAAYGVPDFGSITFAFEISVASDPGATYLTSVTPQDGSTLLASNAEYSYGSGRASWFWYNQTKPSRWDGSGTSTVTVVY